MPTSVVILLNLSVAVLSWVLPMRDRRAVIPHEVTSPKVRLIIVAGLLLLCSLGAIVLGVLLSETWANLLSFVFSLIALACYGIAFYQGMRQNSPTN